MDDDSHRIKGNEVIVVPPAKTKKTRSKKRFRSRGEIGGTGSVASIGTASPKAKKSKVSRLAAIVSRQKPKRKLKYPRMTQEEEKDPAQEETEEEGNAHEKEEDHIEESKEHEERKGKVGKDPKDKNIDLVQKLYECLGKTPSSDLDTSATSTRPKGSCKVCGEKKYCPVWLSRGQKLMQSKDLVPGLYAVYKCPLASTVKIDRMDLDKPPMELQCSTTDVFDWSQPVEERQSDPKPPPRQPNNSNAESEVYEYKSMEIPQMNVILESMLAHGNSGKVAAKKPKAKKSKKRMTPRRAAKTKKNTNKMVKDSKQGKKNPDAEEGEGEAAGDQKMPAVHKKMTGNHQGAKGPTLVPLLPGLGHQT
jgi:hypothetical protein